MHSATTPCGRLASGLLGTSHSQPTIEVAAAVLVFCSIGSYKQQPSLLMYMYRVQEMKRNE